MAGVEAARDPTRETPAPVLWQPDELRVGQSNLSVFKRWLATTHGLDFEDYWQLWQWSVTYIETFWQAIWDYFDIQGQRATRVLSSRNLPGAHWFPGARLNYAEHALRRRGSELAIIFVREDGFREALSYRELSERVATCRAAFARLGVKPGERVVAYLPNCPEAVIAFLATASLGAVWSSCPPEFGVESVLDRFRQIEPRVLVAVDAYPYGGKWFERSSEIERIRLGLPTVEHLVLVPRSRVARDARESSSSNAVNWDSLLASVESAPSPEFERVDFEHPLWILYSSGTTGLPKAIVHGHGGILLEHFKELSLHGDLKPGDRFFWYSTTGWMMWNYLVSGLLVGATIVLYEGSPTYPDLLRLWRLAETEEITDFGVSAPFLMACAKAELKPSLVCDLHRLKSVGSTGAPLPAQGFYWVYEQVSSDLLLGSISGGTDVCTAFIGSCPWLPVRAGELQANSLGAHALAVNPDGHAVRGEVGELVLASPMPSMPVFFWNDPGGERYRDSYFSRYEGVWCHGDWVEYTASGGAVIYGRSDATLNRGGVRMGTSEFYRVVESLPCVEDSLVVDTTSLDDSGKLWLFVVLKTGDVLDDLLRDGIKQALRNRLSPRHVPDVVVQLAEIPRTLSGKKLEVPVKRLLSGGSLAAVVNLGTLKNPESLRELLAKTGADAAAVPSGDAW